MDEVHQTEHFLSGFMGAFEGQLKALANSLEFERVPITWYLPGACTAVLSLNLKNQRTGVLPTTTF